MGNRSVISGLPSGHSVTKSSHDNKILSGQGHNSNNDADGPSNCPSQPSVTAFGNTLDSGERLGCESADLCFDKTTSSTTTPHSLELTNNIQTNVEDGGEETPLSRDYQRWQKWRGPLDAQTLKTAAVIERENDEALSRPTVLDFTAQVRNDLTRKPATSTLQTSTKHVHTSVEDGEEEDLSRVYQRWQEWTGPPNAGDERKKAQAAAVTERKRARAAAVTEHNRARAAAVTERNRARAAAVIERKEDQVEVREIISVSRRESKHAVSRQTRLDRNARLQRDMRKKLETEEETANRLRVALEEEAEESDEDRPHGPPLLESMKERGQKKRVTKSVGSKNFHDELHTTPIVSHLAQEYPGFVEASAAFPPVITANTQRECMNEYLDNVDFLANRSPCGVCGVLAQAASIEKVSADDVDLNAYSQELDDCAVEFNPETREILSVGICTLCMKTIRRFGRLATPKLSGRNDINTTLCQQYPDVLKGLTLVEEFFISQAHLIGYILRLDVKSRPGISYRSVAGHIMAFKQDPSKLLKILPSSELAPHDFITVSWEGQKKPTRENLMRFCQVRKARVLNSLIWLCKHNPLYANVDINTDLLNTWSDEPFIPQGLQDNSIETEPGLVNDRSGYLQDLEADAAADAALTAEFQQHADINDTGVEPLVMGLGLEELDDIPEHVNNTFDPISISTGAFLSDIEQQNVTSQQSDINHLAQLQKIHDDAVAHNNTAVLDHVQYQSIFGVDSFNSWEDSSYLPCAFPTVFPFGTGGHCQHDSSLRARPVSLAAYAQWLLTHHSQRAARHHVLSFVLYDMILLRQSSMGNSIQARNDYWMEGQKDILAMSASDLMAAAISMKANIPCTNPVVNRLLQNMRLISSYNPESFGRKLAQRHVLFGHVIRHGCPAFWFTINPADFRNPVVLRIAGVEIRPELTVTQKDELRRLHAIGNPVIVAQYFHFVVDSFFKMLLRSDRRGMGVLGNIGSHFGVVESNGRLMHHLHGFAWLKGNIDFDAIGEKVIADESFRNRMAIYMQSVISEMINVEYAKQYREENGSIERFVDNPADAIEMFQERLQADQNYQALRVQMHKHTRTCYKNVPKRPRLDANGDPIPGESTVLCRFRFPKPTHPRLGLDADGNAQLVPGVGWIDKDNGVTFKLDTGEIILCRDDPWINKRNPIISSCLRSNHDISFVPGISKMLAALYYMFNYATKDDVKMHQLVLSAALFKAAMEKADASTEQSNIHCRENAIHRGIKPGDFAMKVYNRFQKEREVGAVTISSYLLGQPAFYMPNMKTRIINWYQIKENLRRFADLSRYPSTAEADEVGFEQDNAESSHQEADNDTQGARYSKFFSYGVRTSNYTNYEFRGPRLQHFCCYEYISQIGHCLIRDSTQDSFPFHPDHPKSETHRQYSAPSRINIGKENEQDGLWIPAIHGVVTNVVNSRASAQQVLDDSAYVQNDIDECLLGLFVPWDQLTPLFKKYASDTKLFPQARDACTIIWENVIHSLPPHITRLAKNVCTLRRSTEEAAKDRARMKFDLEEWEDNAMGDNVDNAIEDGLYDDNLQDWDDVSQGAFRYAFHQAVLSWRKGKERRMDILSIDLTDPASLVANPPLGHQGVGERYTQGLAEIWEARYKQWIKEAGAIHEEPLDVELNDNQDRGQQRHKRKRNCPTAIQPIQTSRIVDIETLKGIQQVYNLNPTLLVLMQLLSNRFQLNEKQLLAVTIMLRRALRIESGPYVGYKLDPADQHLIYIAGQGGTGKTTLVQCFMLGMEILGREDEVLIVAPTGAAACQIGGSTIHAAIGIKSDDKDELSQATTASLTKARLRLRKIKIIIIDEISMVGQRLLAKLDARAALIWNLPTDSSAVIGGIPMVVTLGDFRQFPPVGDIALWKKIDNRINIRGRKVWSHFTDVLLLTEQMRQKDDIPYQALLSRASSCCLTDEDILFLNSRTRDKLTATGQNIPALAIRPLNEERIDYNRLEVERFAKNRGQKVWMFAATHSRPKKGRQATANDTREPGVSKSYLPLAHNGQVSLGSLLRTGDLGQLKGPGVLFFTKGMPFMLLSNIHTTGGLCNGRIGTAEDFVLDLHADCYNIDSTYVLCSKPPTCLLVKFPDNCGISYEGLEPGLQPVFPITSSAVIGDMDNKHNKASIVRTQIPVTPAFAVTDFKVQGRTLEGVEVCLTKYPQMVTPHYRWTSLNVQLGRLRSSTGLCLRSPIARSDILARPDAQLEAEEIMLVELAAKTAVNWATEVAHSLNS